MNNGAPRPLVLTIPNNHISQYNPKFIKDCMTKEECQKKTLLQLLQDKETCEQQYKYFEEDYQWLRKNKKRKTCSTCCKIVTGIWNKITLLVPIATPIINIDQHRPIYQELNTIQYKSRYEMIATYFHIIQNLKYNIRIHDDVIKDKQSLLQD
jgi:uncharacterized membrane protein YgaE (UPF0421/DUF939 family)